MKIHPYNNLIILNVLLALLSACDISSPDDGPQVTTSTINAFDVTGNVIADETIELTMNPNNSRSDAEFQLDWDVQSSDPYTVEVYLSTDDVLDVDTDGLFLQTQCGSDRNQFTCEHTTGIACGFSYEPVYETVPLVDDNGDPVFDENGDPVEVPDTDVDGNFIVALDGDRYYLTCADGPPTVRRLEITDWVPQPHGYPPASFTFSNSFIFKACAFEEQSCPEVPVLVQFTISPL